MGKFTQGRFASLSLMKFVEARGDEGECDFCSSPDSQAVGLRDLFVEMSECIRHEYMPASISDDIPGPEWELDPTSLSSTELLSEFDDPLGEGELAETFCRAFDDDWILVGAMFGTHEDHLRWGWEGFVETVKSSSRFVFLHPAAGRTHEITEINTADMLDRLAQVIKNCGALILFPKGQPILRGRKHHPDAVLKSKDDLGAPPAGITPGQRMNPPGIPFFYGAHDERTALAELRGLDGEVATVASWRTVRDSYIVDLAGLVPVPSIFDHQPYASRPEMRFLHRFAVEISKPMRAHDNPDVDFVPTQVVAEFIRHCIHPPDSNEPIEGLRYDSAIQAGGTNLVFFADALNKQPLLEMIGTLERYEAIKVETNWNQESPD
jgi:hypothetical protein